MGKNLCPKRDWILILFCTLCTSSASPTLQGDRSNSIKNIFRDRNKNFSRIPLSSSASLLAASSAISPNTTVWHNSVTQFDPFQVNPFNIGTDRVSFNQNKCLQVATSQIDSRQDSKGEISVSQIGIVQNTAFFISIWYSQPENKFSVSYLKSV